MKRKLVVAIFLAAMLGVNATASRATAASQTDQTGNDAPPPAGMKMKRATKSRPKHRSKNKVKRAAGATERGTKTAGEEVAKGGEDTGKAVVKGSDEAAKGTLVGMQDTGKGAEKGVKKAGKATAKAARKIGKRL